VGLFGLIQRMARPSLVNSTGQHLVTKCLQPARRHDPAPAVVRLVRIITWRKRTAANPLPKQARRASGFLCTDLWMTCVKQRWLCVQAGEMLGIAVPDHAHNRIVSWQNAIHTLCIEKD